MILLALVTSACTTEEDIGVGWQHPTPSVGVERETSPLENPTLGALPAPALPEQSPEFVAAANRFLNELAQRGYDTTTGEIGSSDVETRFLTASEDRGDLPEILLSLEWERDIPYGDLETMATMVIGDLVIHEYRNPAGVVGVWFRCGRMLAVVRMNVDTDQISDLAAELHRDACP